ncbi:Regulator of Chromosome Condensation (RCC1) repeat protein [Brevibacillus sp. AG162]|nr:Regulator of Chromosome Condensation (RCC1) repeat protein [Brevibacillus sp. AG162]
MDYISPKDAMLKVKRWSKDTIAAGDWHTIGLKLDGTATAVGWNEYGQCNISDWRDIVAIAAGCAHTVGLKSDGTVVAVGDNEYGQCDVSSWRGIQLPEN